MYGTNKSSSDDITISYPQSSSETIFIDLQALVDTNHPFLGLENDCSYNSELLLCLGKAFAQAYKLFPAAMISRLNDHPDIWTTLGRIFIRWLRQEDLQLDQKFAEKLCQIDFYDRGIFSNNIQDRIDKAKISHAQKISEKFTDFFYRNSNPPKLSRNIVENISIYNIFETSLEIYKKVVTDPEVSTPLDMIKEFNIQNLLINADTSDDTIKNSFYP